MLRGTIMVRPTLKNDVPDEWRRRAKAGLCPVCAKTPNEWEKGQRVFCSKTCREAYSDKYAWWSEVRNKILERDNYICQKCKSSRDKHTEMCNAKKKEVILEWAKNHPDEMQTFRDEQLVRLDRRFKIDYDEIMDNYWLAERQLSWDAVNKMLKGIPREPNMEVDHKVAVALGGDMWDEDNMQTMCNKCHKVKTKEDMQKLKALRGGRKT